MLILTFAPFPLGLLIFSLSLGKKKKESLEGKEIFINYCYGYEKQGEFQQLCGQVYNLESFLKGEGGIQGENQASLVERSGLYTGALNSLLGEV